MALYTPFFERAADRVGQAYGERKVGELAQAAYMGDEQALGELYRFNPQLGNQIRSQKLQEEQAKLATTAANQSIRQNDQQWAMQNQQIVRQVMQDALKLPSHAQAQQYVAQQIEQLKQSGIQVPPSMDASTFTPEVYNQLKQVLSQQQSPIKVGAGETLVDPSTMQPVFTGPNEAPAAFRALESRAQAAGLRPGTEEYQQFMAQGGSTPAGNQRSQRIASLIPQLLSMGMDEQQAQTEAANIADGNVRYDTLESGQVRRVDQVSGKVSEVPIESSGQSVPVPAPGKTLYELASAGTGLLSGVRAALSGTVGQIPGAPIAEQTIDARTRLTTASNELIRALAVNPRFPVAEIQRIENEIQTKPSVLDSPGALQARMIALAGSLRTRRDQAARDADDPSMPEPQRRDQRANAIAIDNFLATLGAPEAIQASTLDSPAAVNQLDKSTLELFINNASDEELNSLSDEVEEAILKIMEGR